MTIYITKIELYGPKSNFNKTFFDRGNGWFQKGIKIIQAIKICTKYNICQY